MSLFLNLIYYFTLQYCIGFTIHWLESSMGVHVSPILNLPFHLPPHPIPLGHPSAPALSTLSHASNLDWWFISHMIIYMFQCHSPKSSHPHPLPQREKIFSRGLHINLLRKFLLICNTKVNSIDENQFSSVSNQNNSITTFNKVLDSLVFKPKHVIN